MALVTQRHSNSNLSRQVYKARDKATGEIVALKRVRMDNEKEGVRWHAPPEKAHRCSLASRPIGNLSGPNAAKIVAARQPAG